MALVSVRKSDIPDYLHKSDFYLALNDDDEDEEVHIPQNCFKADTDVQNADDLTLLLSTLRFWGVSAIPQSVVKYTVWHKPVEVIDAFVELEQELRYVKFLRALCEGAEKCMATGWKAVWDRYLGRYSGNTGMARVAELCVFHYEYRYGVVWDATTCSLAATAGELEVLRFLHEHGCPWDENCCVEAVRSDSLKCLKYAHEHGCPWSSITCANAAGHGKLECLKYAHENGCPWDAVICMNAATIGSLECLRYAHENGCPWGPEAYKDARAGSACYRYLCDNGCPEGEASCIAAAKAGDLARLKALHESGCEFSKRVSTAAVESEVLDVLKYLHGVGCPWDDDICDVAAKCYSDRCLRYLRENGTACTALTAVIAATTPNSIKCFKYLVDEGINVREACQRAARHGNGAALLYALQKGTEILSATCAVECGSLACLKHIHEHGGSWDEKTCAAAAKTVLTSEGHAIAGSEKLACLRYAHENGCPWDSTTCAIAASNGNLAILKYAHEHDCPWDAAICIGAADGGHLACLKYAHEHGCPWNLEAVKDAASWGSLSCLQYLHEHGCEWPEPAWFVGVHKDVFNRKCLQYAAEHPDRHPAPATSIPVDCACCAARASQAALAEQVHHESAYTMSETSRKRLHSTDEPPQDTEEDSGLTEADPRQSVAVVTEETSQPPNAGASDGDAVAASVDDGAEAGFCANADGDAGASASGSGSGASAGVDADGDACTRDSGGADSGGGAYLNAETDNDTPEGSIAAASGKDLR